MISDKKAKIAFLGGDMRLSFAIGQLSKIYENIFNTAPEKRKDIKGMDVTRADIILAGLTPAKVLMDMIGSPCAYICASGVKEGVFFRMKEEMIK